MRKLFYLLVIPSVGSFLANVIYTLPQLVTWPYTVLCLLVLSLLALKAVRSPLAMVLGQGRCQLMAGLLIAPLIFSLLICQFGEPSWEIGFDITWPVELHHNGSWLVPYLPTHVVVTQHMLARAALVEGGGWTMFFIVLWKRRPQA
ncbi:MAG: hypothetical protein HY565_05505 [Candidatus Kerfeldbacteria bacterium]|nr:hypothetical protein [Candidatus Kerfeldbacteria bacterium]